MTKNLLAVPVAALMAFALVGCDSSASGGDSNLSYRNKSLPEGLGLGVPNSLRKSDKNNDAKGDDSLGGGGSNLSYAYLELTGQVEQARAATTDFEQSMKKLDTVMDEIRSYCSSVEKGKECVIPAGTISIIYSPNLLGSLQTMDAGGQDMGSGEEQAAEGETRPMGEVRYTVDPGEPYDWSLTANMRTDDEKEKATYRWNAAKTRLFVNRRVDWNNSTGEGFNQSHLVYSEDTDAGKKYDMQNKWSRKNGSEKDVGTYSQKVQELNDGKEGVSIDSSLITEYNAKEQHQTWQGKANKEGGAIDSMLDIEGANRVFYKESFDADGHVVSALQCEQVSENYCDTKSNWVEKKRDNAGGDVWFVDGNQSPEGAGVDGRRIRVTGLGDSVQSFIVVAKGEDPKQPSTAILCFGFKTVDRTEVSCWASDDKLANVDFYSEHYNDENGMISYELKLITGAKLTIEKD